MEYYSTKETDNINTELQNSFSTFTLMLSHLINLICWISQKMSQEGFTIFIVCDQDYKLDNQNVWA